MKPYRKYIILFLAPLIYYVICKLYANQSCPPEQEMTENCRMYTQLFALGIHIIILMFCCFPLVIEHGDRVFNVWVGGMAIYLVINNVLNEASELISIILHCKNKYSPYYDTIGKEIMFIGMMLGCAIRVWYLKRIKKVWGQ